jgi:type II secretory pathway component PulJ
MQNPKSLVSPRHASRVVRRRLREAEVFISPHTMRRSVGWVLKWRRLRTGRSAAQVARLIDVVPQTVRDIEEAHYGECGWTKVYLLAHASGRRLPRVEMLAARYLMFDLRQERRRHAGEAGWRYRYPWSKKRATPRIRCGKK